MIYWDTSCVIKLYAEESDSTVWQRRACEGTAQRVSSAVMCTEMAYALRQKEHRGDIVRGGASALLDMLDRDVAAGRFTVFPTGEDVLAEAAAIACVCFRAAAPLRTLDGIHLATARLLRCTGIATTDARMCAGAAILGLNVL